MDEKQPVKSTPRDFFMYLLSTITLYASVVAVITLLFQFINAALPDPVNPAYGLAGTVRWFVAMLIIVFPVYLWTTVTLARERDREPGRSDFRVRKWLLYLTIFLAALVIIGDLVALVFNFLNGELSARFYLKVLAVLLVAGSVFGYYLYDLRRAAGDNRKSKWLIGGSSAAIAAIVIGGFFVVGSPFAQRAIRFDERRISELSNLQYQIENYYGAKSRLPAALADLSVLGGVPVLKDPVGKDYGYQAKGSLAYELCADFDATSAQAQKYEYVIDRNLAQLWAHEAGRQCFERTIDPEVLNQRYPAKPIVPPAAP